MDQASLLAALTVFLQSAGVDVCSPEPLHTSCLQRFLSAMEAKDPLVSTSFTGDASVNSTLKEDFMEDDPLRISIPQNSASSPDVFMNYDLFLVVKNL